MFLLVPQESSYGLEDLGASPRNDQAETWAVHERVREPHLNPPIRVLFLRRGPRVGG